MNDAQIDSHLALRAAEGDTRAFSQLVHRHGRGLAQAARSFGIPETDVDDVVQDTFIAAWNALDSFDQDKVFRAWLFRIGLNKMRDLYRFRRVRNFLFGAQDLGEVESFTEEPSPERVVEGRNHLAHVVRVLRELDTASREVIILISLLEMSQSEVALVLGVSAKAVESRLARARTKLRILLESSERKKAS